MRRRYAAGVIAMLAAAAPPAFAQAGSGFYFGSGLGVNFATGMEFAGIGYDGPSDCDAYVNPLAPEDPDCASPGTSAWESAVGSGRGLLAGAVLGYRLPDTGLRVEVEYFYRESAFNETAAVAAAGGATFAKLGGELQRAEDRIGSVTSNNLFGNAYYDFSGDGPLTPYVGFGVGVGVTEMDYVSLWARNFNPDAISTGAGRPNAEEIRRNLAGSTSVARADLDDTLFGYQVLAGVRYALSDSVALDFKGRWVDYGAFGDDGGIVWDPLRSHPPARRRDGSQPVSGGIETGDMRLFGVSAGLTYGF